MIETTLDILRELIAFDTTNPPRAIGADGIFDVVRTRLVPAGFDVQLTDLGDGCLNLLAVRGTPAHLFNVHLDTVPADAGWTADPFTLKVEDGRAIGLGACDVKGAAACLVAAATTTTGPAALLLTSDEEAGCSECVRAFLEEVPPFIEGVVVAEPTGCEAVVAHRGLQTCEGVFSGTAAHGSLDASETRNAVHHAAQWAQAALQRASTVPDRYDGLKGLRLNVGVLEGGVKPNVAASSARIAFGVRPLPHQCGRTLLKELWDLAPPEACVSWTPKFVAPSLEPSEGSQRLVEALGLDAAPAVDFWTEAALFAEAGLPAIVFGPGSIRQAHTADEWIDLVQLETATAIYTRLLAA